MELQIVIAPDSFKECLPAHRVCEAIAEGVRRVAPDAEIRAIPMADGGQGTVESVVRATGGRFLDAEVTGPLGDRVSAQFGLLGDGSAAILEMAAASGLEITPPEQRDPLITTTYGTGELIRAALDAGVARIVLGIGGSATNDGGAGMAQALGFALLDDKGAEIGRGGGSIDRLARIDVSGRDPRLADVVVDVACDVTNPLTGPDGASAVYGPQKGATGKMVTQLDENLSHFASIVRRDLEIDIADTPGAGAAGGLGGGLLAFCNARLQRGVELVIGAVGLRDKLDGADLCLTGEGAIDHSSRFGKTAVGVAAVCREEGVPVVALTGAVKQGARAVLDEGITAYFDVTPHPCTLSEAFANAQRSLADTAEQVVRLFLARS